MKPHLSLRPGGEVTRTGPSAAHRLFQRRTGRAIERGEPWLRVALNQVADGNTTRLDDDTVQRLERLADHRADHPLPPTAPIDSSWWTPDTPWLVRLRSGEVAGSGA